MGLPGVMWALSYKAKSREFRAYFRRFRQNDEKNWKELLGNGHETYLVSIKGIALNDLFYLCCPAAQQLQTRLLCRTIWAGKPAASLKLKGGTAQFCVGGGENPEPQLPAVSGSPAAGTADPPALSPQAYIIDYKYSVKRSISKWSASLKFCLFVLLRPAISFIGFCSW